ncbi:MAG: hypothetical protein PGN24_03435 [Microbacterium arborescens]
MGLFDKLTAAFAGATPDYVAEIAAANDHDGDTVLTFSRSFPAAYTRGGAAGTLSVDGVLFSKALAAVENKVAGSKHVVGEAGSIARTLTQESDLRVLALGEHRVTWWDFGMTGTQPPAELVQSISRDDIASIVDTGKRAQGGTLVTRFTFVDGSAFDYRLLQPSDDFWTVAARYPRTASV